MESGVTKRFALFCLIFAFCSSAYASFGFADVNRSENVDAIDVQITINGVLGLCSGQLPDVDRNSCVDAVDVQLVVNAVLGIGGDGDGADSDGGNVPEDGSYPSKTDSDGPDSEVDEGSSNEKTDGPVMSAVRPGWFIMGASENEEALLNETPAHNVYLDAYEIGRYEVTNGEFCEMLNWAFDKGYLEDSRGGPYVGGDVYASGKMLVEVSSSYCQIAFSEGGFVVEERETYSMHDHPVVEVSWFGAVAYCNWLSEAQGLELCYNLMDWSIYTDKKGYRLPTEAEWECAAAWDGSYHWIYGSGKDTAGENECNNFGSEYSNPLGLDSFPYTSPAGWFDGINVSPRTGVTTSTSVSPAGCYDMCGNVWEWCHDWYGSYTPADQINPRGPDSGAANVLRGGGWLSYDKYCRSAYRLSHSPWRTHYYLGFRIARNSPLP